MKNTHIDRLLLVAGCIWLLLGVTALLSPSLAYLVIIRYSGLALLLDGLLLLALSILDGNFRERAWRIAECIADLCFCSLLLLDPVFTLFIFPFIIIPWMAVKGLIKIIGSLVLARHARRWRGDLIGGLLMLAFSIFIPHDPTSSIYSVELLIGIIGLTLGLLYCYDYFRLEYPHKITNKPT
ncbi:MAG TPA: DUF308 domain-containing protein [Puia sp.]|jgi:uncharacterized membrane protein HdeD (DUF308 family)|nr:DUF308 domain-containing protein [Puia sp.]